PGVAECLSEAVFETTDIMIGEGIFLFLPCLCVHGHSTGTTLPRKYIARSAMRISLRSLTHRNTQYRNIPIDRAIKLAVASSRLTGTKCNPAIASAISNGRHMA